MRLLESEKWHELLPEFADLIVPSAKVDQQDAASLALSAELSPAAKALADALSTNQQENTNHHIQSVPYTKKSRDPRLVFQAAYILHRTPYRETSLILDVFTRDFGRVPLVAKGAKRPNSSLRPVLQAFCPLVMQWSGKGDIKTLTKAEWGGRLNLLQGNALLCGFYINELLLRLLPRGEANSNLFDYYQHALIDLANISLTPKGGSLSLIVRRFERLLLTELGLCLSFSEDEMGDAIEADKSYCVHVAQGVIEAVSDAAIFPDMLMVSGQTLLDIAEDKISSSTSQVEGKQLMRALLQHHLGNHVLQTRQMMIALQNL